jgi:heme exporter protein D
LAIEWDQVLIENILLAAIIVGSIYLERWLVEKSRRRKEREARKKIINTIINDLENKLRLLESNQYKNYIPFFTDMWDAIILTGKHSLLSFETFEDLQHTYSWMKYYNTDLNIGKSDEDVLKDLLTNVKKSINQSLKNLAETKNL